MSWSGSTGKWVRHGMTKLPRWFGTGRSSPPVYARPPRASLSLGAEVHTRFRNQQVGRAGWRWTSGKTAHIK